MLCNARRYSSLDYLSNAPSRASLPDSPNVPIAINTNASPQERLKNLQERVKVLEESGVKDKNSHNASDHAEAADHLLVYKFLTEEGNEMEERQGSQNINENEEIPTHYSLYGRRSAEERLEKVQKLLHQTFQVHVEPPLQGESREQYWRRLGLYYAKKKFNVCHDFRYGNEVKNESEITRKNGKADATNNNNNICENMVYGDSFYLVDFGRLIEQMAKWRKLLPMVRPFYAVKCNPYPPLLSLLAALGAGFDCASKREIELVKDLLDDPEREIIFAQPCKRVEDLKMASAVGVRYATVDNEEELKKMAIYFPEAKGVLRLATDDAMATCQLSAKFGARMEDVENLLRCATELEVKICGVSFHVGSGNSDPGAYIQALKDAKHVFTLAKQYGHADCHLLDIGGGFSGSLLGLYDEVLPTSSMPSSSTSQKIDVFKRTALAIRPVLEKDFKDAIIISEPGRYFAESTHALLMHVFGKRKVLVSSPPLPPFPSTSSRGSCSSAQEGGASCSSIYKTTEYQYYVNDGLYHSFNCILYDHAHPYLLLLQDDEAGLSEKKERGMSEWNDGAALIPPRRVHRSTIFGPTCDSLDCILKSQPFPEMFVGDWLLSPDMGSYTTAGGSCFNGIATQRMVFISSIVL